MTAASKTVAIIEVAMMMGVLARRTSVDLGEADVFREETSKRTGKARRGTGPSTYIKIEEITSGRANSQQGYAATCKDLQHKGTNRGCERVLVWRMSQYERRGSSNVDLCRSKCDTPRGNTPKRQRGSRYSDRP
jgi:hypothetical protein